jgi:hypothetical protein
VRKQEQKRGMIVLDQTNANIERHIKTHSVRSDDDRAAVSVLETFLRSNGRINTSFTSDDKWSNHDGTFEFVPDPDISRGWRLRKSLEGGLSRKSVEKNKSLL